MEPLSGELHLHYTLPREIFSLAGAAGIPINVCLIEKVVAGKILEKIWKICSFFLRPTFP